METHEEADVVYSSLQAFDELVASGIPESQARAIVQSQERSTADLATKGDLDNLREDLQNQIEKMFWRAIAIQAGIGITIAAAAVAIAEAL